jgi:hypothetical protein
VGGNPDVPDQTGFNTLIGTVSAIITLLGAILAAVGITAGIITALLRNDTSLTLAFLGLALAGILLGLLSAFIGARSSAVRGAMAMGGVALLFIGTGLVIWRATDILKTASRPSIAITVTPLDEPVGWASLQATVSASGITTRQRYFIHAELLDRQQKPTNEPVFTSFVGPSTDGALDYTFTAQFPLDKNNPWIAVTAELDQEGSPTYGTQQTCGLPVDERPPPIGTTCTIAKAPIPSPSVTTSSPKRTS